MLAHCPCQDVHRILAQSPLVGYSEYRISGHHILIAQTIINDCKPFSVVMTKETHDILTLTYFSQPIYKSERK
jgi:hypothetical protein